MLPASGRLRRSGDYRVALRRGPRTFRRGGRLLATSLHVTSLNGERATSLSAKWTLADRPQAVRPPVAQPARVGIVVSKAVGGAVTRNQVKRRLRALARERYAVLPPGSSLVLSAKPPAATASSQELGVELDTELRALLARAAS